MFLILQIYFVRSNSVTTRGNFLLYVIDSSDIARRKGDCTDHHFSDYPTFKVKSLKISQTKYIIIKIYSWRLIYGENNIICLDIYILLKTCVIIIELSHEFHLSLLVVWLIESEYIVYPQKTLIKTCFVSLDSEFYLMQENRKSSLTHFGEYFLRPFF